MNPFSRDIVKNPREVPTTVASLNRGVLEALEAAFLPLTAAARPRPAEPAPKARLVLSPAPGYGKSHLIARLAANLADRANVIPFTPFQTVGLCWQSLLLQVLKTLQSPASSPAGPASRTRLESLAEEVIRHLLAQALKTGLLNHPEPDKAARWALDQLTLGPPDEGRPWNAELRDLFQNQPAIWRATLADTGVSLEEESWLAVLFRYATSPVFSDQRQDCLAWMRGQALSTEARAELGLSNRAAPAQESASAEDLNDRCRARFHDLCRLAAFHRPFVFCFDQTEVFAQNANLALTFGRVVAELVNEVPHHLTVVTANQTVWDTKIFLFFENADKARFQNQPTLKGLHRPEGIELIALLTKSCAHTSTGVKEHGRALARVTDAAWLDSLFPTPATNIPAREFLHHCQRRWEGLDPDPAPSAGAPTAPQPKPDPDILTARYQELYTSVFAAGSVPNATELFYNPDLFRWLISTLVAQSDEKELVSAPNKYAEIQWNLPGKAVIRFGFADAGSDSWGTWRQFAEYAQNCRRSDKTPVSKLILFRTPDIQRGPIPRDSWKTSGPAILAALDECLEVIDLTLEETAALHAARQLYLEAESGDLEGFKGQDTLPFLAEKLAPWRLRLLAPPKAPADRKNGSVTSPVTPAEAAIPTPAPAPAPVPKKPQPATAPAPAAVTPKPKPAASTPVTATPGSSSPAPAPVGKPRAPQKPKSPPLPQPQPQTSILPQTPEPWRPRPEPDLSKAIVEAYASFKISVEATGRLEAPQLIRYHLRPGPGVAFTKISGHSVNLKIQLGLELEPLIAPGRGHVNFDVVKNKPDTILWRDAMQRPEIARHPSSLALPIGVNIRNELIIADLCDSNTAHALIGGSSGSGKSELLKALVATLVQRNTPESLRLTLIDPKLLTFGGIQENPFLTGPVLRDIGEALTCLREAVGDMERRYEILVQGHFSHLSERRAAGLTDIPFRVIVFDEFADLINSGKDEKKEFERLIKSLSSKGRAAGVHLIIATQRPDREVVTGQLKANLPLKICLRVTNAINSQILLDEAGAELLLGRGDLLCQSGALPERGQGLFVTQEEFLDLFGPRPEKMFD